jgi:hypothetical protein
VNPEEARYVIHEKHPNYIRYDDEHMWISSEEDNAPGEEESDDDLEEEYDFETKADDYLNDLTQSEVFENNN